MSRKLTCLASLVLVPGIVGNALLDDNCRENDTWEATADNTGTDATTYELTVNTAAPVVTVDSLLTNDDTPQLTGTVNDPAAIILVTVAGNIYAAVNNGDGIWTLADDTISPALVDGMHDVAVTATDAAGSTGTDATIAELAVTVTPPIIDLNIDIHPNRVPNRVYLSRNYTIYVAVLGSVDFDVTNTDSSSVLFGRTGTEANPVRTPILRDLNSDGFLDATYGFHTFDCGFQLGDTEGRLTGFTINGAPVEGVDSVLVSP